MSTPPRDPVLPSSPLPPEVAQQDADAKQRYDQVRRLSRVLDSLITIPGTSRTFGVDAILGLIPGIGGAAGLVLSAVIIGQGIMIGARGATVVRMLLNAGIDAMFSTVPVLGLLVDLVFKANERNVRLLSTHALDPQRTRAESRRMVVRTVLVIIAVMISVLVLAVVALILFLRWLF